MTRQERLDNFYRIMRQMSTMVLIAGELQHIVDLAKSLPGLPDERLAIFETIMQERGILRRPPERPSERAMRLTKQKERTEERSK